MTDARAICTCGNGNIIPDDNDCVVQSHEQCDLENCVVRQAEALTQSVSTAQVHVGIITAVVSLSVATLVALSIVGVWLHAALLGMPMPPIPWILTSLVSAAFISGTVTALRLPRKAPLQIGDHHDVSKTE